MTSNKTWPRVAGLAVVVMVLLAMAFVLVDSPDSGPTNYESTVSQIEPTIEGVSFHVAGGDAYLVVEGRSGHQILVPGYFGEPYVRIDADGLVFVNESSPAFLINADRYGQVTAPVEGAGDDEQRWVHVGSGGTFAWLDHRTHWMSSDLPPAVAGDQRELVFPWEVPVEIDGQLAKVSGELVWEPSRNPIPALMAGSIVLVPLILVRRRQSLWLATAISATAFTALVVTIAQTVAIPSSVRSIHAVIVYPILAIGFGAWAAAGAVKSRGQADYLSLAASLLLIPWVAVSVSSLWLPVLSSAFPAAVDRALVALVAWATLAVAVACIARISVGVVASRGPHSSTKVVDPSNS